MDNFIVLGIGISINKCDGILRFENFCQNHGLNYQIIGTGQIWKGGDMANGPGGGQKINQLKMVLEEMENKLVIVCDTFDLFPLAGIGEIIHKFNHICGRDRILFSAEVFCWPDKKLAEKYPDVDTKYKYLNSGCIMGYRDNIYKLIVDAIKDDDDDQLYFTEKFLANNSIMLDYDCHIFQTLNGVLDDIVLHKNRLYNIYTNSYPIFIHGNGPAKIHLNYLENYIESNPSQIYQITDHIKFNYTVLIALYINSDDKHSLKIFMDKVKNINYCFSMIHIYDKTMTPNNEILRMYYPNFKNIIYQSGIKNYQFNDSRKYHYDYYFLLEQKCIITDQEIVHKLINLSDNNHRIISPMMVSINNSFFANFWGALDSNGYYLRSNDYFDLIGRVYRGLWNVPYVTGSILFHRSIIDCWNLDEIDGQLDDDMQLCQNLRKNCLFMYMTNLEDYGYLY